MPNQPAKNFYGGRYNMEVLQEDRIMYRAGNTQNPYGRWFTSEPPASVANVRIDTAVKTHWIDPKTGAYEASSYIDNVYAIKVTKGTVDGEFKFWKSENAILILKDDIEHRVLNAYRINDLNNLLFLGDDFVGIEFKNLNQEEMIEIKNSKCLL